MAIAKQIELVKMKNFVCKYGHFKAGHVYGQELSDKQINELLCIEVEGTPAFKRVQSIGPDHKISRIAPAATAAPSARERQEAKERALAQPKVAPRAAKPAPTKVVEVA